MKILHTSDLHLGKKLLEESFHDDQEHILKKIIKIVEDEKIDVVMIAGDIYDKSVPPADAVNLFDSFISNLVEMNVKILISSGNHDSNDRLSYGSEIFKKSHIHIATSYDGQIYKVTIDNVNFYLLPFLRPFHLKRLIDEGLMDKKDYENIKNSNDMMDWILSNEDIDTEETNILLVHQFVKWKDKLPKTSDSESNLLYNVGTLDAIDVGLFDDFDYVALGHLHRPQSVKEDTIRYSGTPLKYSFSEVKDKKSVVIIDTDNMENIEFVELEPLREMQVLKGKFEDIMKMEPSDDIIKVKLLDENTIVSPMEEIRQRFKNAISLEFINNYESHLDPESKDIIEDASPYELFTIFFDEQNGREMTEGEEDYIKSIIKSLEEDD